MQKIWFFYCLQRAGYAILPNSLSLDEWLDLGTMKDELEMMRLGKNG